MAKTQGLDNAKIAALMLFISASLALCGWAMWDAFGEAGSGSPLSQEYQAAVGDPKLPTPTEWQPLQEPTPLPTDPFPLEN